MNYLEDCTVFEVINFSDFIFGFLTTHINNFTLPAGSARTPSEPYRTGTEPGTELLEKTTEP